MQLFDELNKGNFILFAARNYYSPRCIDAEEFYDDLNRFKYIKRLVNRHQRGGDLGEKLLLNHITVILNVFGHDAGLRMLEHKVGIENFDVIKPFLFFMGVIPYDEYSDITMDQTVVEKLGKL
jgi:hypothetical protein